MKQIVYLSTASRAMADAELDALMEISQRNNARLGITGLLIVKGRTFMQALEGESATVDALFQRIEQDDRHKNIIIISEENITERQFPQWHMGFRNLEKLPPIRSQRLLDATQMEISALATQPALVHDLFKIFVNTQ